MRIFAVIGATSVASAGLAACGSESSTSTGVQADAADERRDGSGDEGTDSSIVETGAQDSAGDELPPTVRRPFLVGASMRSARSERRDDWISPRARASHGTPTELDTATTRELAKVWLADALEEHASIAAFARFTMSMLSVGAPPELVVASQRASIDEVAHARECFALARRYGAPDAGPGPLDVHDSMSALSLAELAALTTEEGCIGETLGAALAGEQLAAASDDEVRRVLSRIAADEARHAELAWRFVAWAIGEERRGSLGAAGVTEAVRRAADHAIRATRAMTIRPGPADLAAWHAHGRLTCAEAREASERALQGIVLPSLQQLTRVPADRVISSSGCDGRMSSA